MDTVPEPSIETSIDDYTKECMTATGLSETELKKFFDAYLGSVFLDSGKQRRFEELCKRYSRYEK